MRWTLMVVLALVAATVTGCGGGDGRAVTVDGDSSHAQGTSGSTVTGAGTRLTAKQARAGLPKVTDLPSGWTLGKGDDDDDDFDDVQPKRCQPLLNSIDDIGDKAAVRVDRSYNKGGSFGTYMSVRISSYDDEVDSGAINELADVFTKCPKFNETDDGTVSHYRVAPLSLARLGDTSLALTMTVKSDGFTVPVNYYVVVIGHNALTFTNAGVAGADGAQLETVARQVIKRLDRAAG